MYLRVSTKPLPNDAKNSLPVDVRRSKTLLLKLPFERYERLLGNGLELACNRGLRGKIV